MSATMRAHARRLRDLADRVRENASATRDLHAQALDLHRRELAAGVYRRHGQPFYLYLTRSRAEAHAEERDATARLRGYLRDLDAADVPARVRLVERCSAEAWHAAPDDRRVVVPWVIHAALDVRDGAAEVLLERGLTPQAEAWALAHEARHAWQQLRAPEHRRWRDAVDAERDADRWADEALRRRGLTPPAWTRDRDLRAYGGANP